MADQPNIVLAHGAWADGSWEETMGPPAWKSFPSWFLVAEGDQTIPPDAQRQFAARMGATTHRGLDESRGDGLAP